MIGAILATDMSLHFNKLNEFKEKVLTDTFDPATETNKIFCCDFMFHLADISNPTKTFEIC